MTLDGLLTVLALFAAIYAVLSPVQRMQASLAWRLQTLVAVPALVAIVALEMFGVGPPRCPAALGRACGWITLAADGAGASRDLAFLVACAWLAVAAVIHRGSQPTVGSVPAFARLATALIDEERLGDALKLLEPELDLLAAASRRRCARQRLRDWLEGFGPTPEGSFASFALRPGDRRWSGEQWPAWAARPVRWLARLVPSYARSERAAGDVLQLLLNSDRLLAYIVERRPYFGIGLIRQDAFGAPDFCEHYLGALIGSPGGALYRELATNGVSEGAIGYRIPERNRLLHYLFADARNAERLSAWKPVGDYVERLLDGDERAGYAAWLNDAPHWFDRDQYRDPTFMGMFFFDVMVTSAARQGVGYHMWLLYLPHFAERLERVYDASGDGIDREAEFPIRAARLLYELVQTLKGWVDLFERLPDGSVHAAFPDRRDHPGTIPHAAAVALGHVLATVVRSRRIDHGVVQTLHEVAIRQVRDLHPDGGSLSRMRAYLIDALLKGGPVAP